MAIGFSYTLSPDEAKSMKELQAFVDKVADKKISLSLDFTGGKTGNGFDKVLSQLEKELISSKNKLSNILGDVFEKIEKSSFKDMFPLEELTEQINNLHKTARTLNQLEKQSTAIEQGIGRWNDVLEKTTSLTEEVSKSTEKAVKGTDNKQIEELAKSYQQIIDKKVRAIVDSKQFAKVTEEEQLAFAQLASSMKVAGKSADELEKDFKEMFAELSNQEQLLDPTVIDKQIKLIQDKLFNRMNSVALKAEKLGLQGLVPIEEIERQINALGKSGESLRQIKFIAAQINTELQTWGQAVDSNKRDLSEMSELTGNLAQMVAERKEVAKNDEVLQNYLKSRQSEIDAYIKRIRLSNEYLSQTEKEKKRIDDIAESLKIEAFNMEGVDTQYTQMEAKLRNQEELLNAKHIDSVTGAYDKLGGTIQNLVVRYASLQLVLHQMKQYFQETIQYTYDIDDAYTDVAVSMDITRKEFNKWTEDAQAIARANGVATTSIMDMVKIYAAAGEDINDISDKLAGTAAIQNITQFDTETTTNIVNSIIAQFKLLDKEINGTTGNVSNAINYMGDRLIAISNELSIDNVKGIQEMANAIDDAGSVINASGGTMEWYMGVTGALAEATNSTGKYNPPCL